MEQLDPTLKNLAEKSAAKHAEGRERHETLPEKREAFPTDWEKAERDYLEDELGQRIPYEVLDRYMEWLATACYSENTEIMRPGSPSND